MSSIDRHRRASAIAGIGIVATLALGACSAASTSPGRQGSTAGSAPAVGAPPGGEPASGDKAGAAGVVKDGSAAKPPAATPEDPQKLVRTAHIRLSVDDVTAGAAGVRGVALGVGGMVTAEDVSTSQPVPGPPQPTGTTPDPKGTTSVARRQDTGTVTIAVPAAQLDTALDQLAKLGAVVQRTSSSQDVTSTYVDTSSRIGTMKTSIDRLRALMAQTTGIDQIVRLETELSQREADLESLQAKLATLDKQVTMSTVVITLTSTVTPTTTPPEETGFLAGIRSGWKVFTGLFVGLFTVVGAVLPFGVTLAVLALPALVWWRRRPRTTRKAAGRGRAFAAFDQSRRFAEADPDELDEEQPHTVSATEEKAHVGSTTVEQPHGGSPTVEQSPRVSTTPKQPHSVSTGEQSGGAKSPNPAEEGATAASETTPPRSRTGNGSRDESK